MILQAGKNGLPAKMDSIKKKKKKEENKVLDINFYLQNLCNISSVALPITKPPHSFLFRWIWVTL